MSGAQGPFVFSGILFQLLATTNAPAQDFLPYPPASTAFVTEWDGSMLFIWAFGENYTMHRGDTVTIAGQTWKEIEVASRSEFSALDTTFITVQPCTFHSYMRCDSNGVTWMRWSPSDTAGIWFDPSIHPGDTVPGTWYFGQYSDPIVMTAIDTLPDLYGADRRRYHFYGEQSGEWEFIEGIGSVLWSQFEVNSLGFHSESDTAISTCVTTVGTEEVHRGWHGPRIVENPVIETLRLADPPGTPVRYTILDVSGLLVRSGTVENGRIEVGALTPAPYVLQMHLPDGRQLAAIRFIKATVE